MRTKLFASAAVLTALLVLGDSPTRLFAADEDGVAVAIVYDTSGSMKETVKDSAGKMTPKYVIANRALEAIARQIEKFATNSAGGGPRQVKAGLFVFDGSGARQAVAFGPFDAAAIKGWARRFQNPEGGTPLGTALTTAGQVVLNSGLARKHVLVITDGMNTVGPDPAATLPRLKQQAAQKGTTLTPHFVAFDVNAQVFNGVKKLGATVVGAANETQLNEQLNFILEKKILLEEEEPPKKK
jgi:hypothetical protein